ncbi:hypothetical protein [Paenibacillus sp. LjRoot56]|uniref:hypothetical protein n=1 Tax=Paenibacillus sp. LjRoot56 TaxID=3342333 RepID=UPI003F506EB1
MTKTLFMKLREPKNMYLNFAFKWIAVPQMRNSILGESEFSNSRNSANVNYSLTNTRRLPRAAFCVDGW